MNQDLVFRLRTCAAAMLTGNPDWLTRVRDDAANLMIEASNTLDVEEPISELMPVLEAKQVGGPTWTTGTSELPTATAKPCPSCGNVAARKVRIANRHLYLTCPMCTHEWEYTP